MILYHGTNSIIKSIDLSHSRVGKDFGAGFYLTPDEHIAQRQAERKFERFVEDVMNGKETFMVETLTRELITRLMEERSITMREAMDIVYSSKTYTALNNLKTGLYFQSPAYVYDVLKIELLGGAHE